ncbi:MAG: DIM/SIM/IMP family subclass B1 metallo-beta-lactamase [Pseudomonadales bacterium]|nr:DIM/SIM/IMP family subclass B1 metallo-beta-lactamase [Pseudomonadales bacterium]
MKWSLAFVFWVLAGLSLANEKVPDMEIRPLEEGVYLHTSYKVVDGFGLVDANGLVVRFGDDAYIIDTPWSDTDTQVLLDWIASQGMAVKGSVSTHWHEDRTAGIALLNARSIPTYASKQTNTLLAEAGKAQATHAFDETVFALLEEKIEVFYPGPGHTRDNLVVWLPQSDILLGGCMIRAAESDNLGYTGEASIDKWSDSVARVQSRYQDIRYVVPGHGKVGDASLLAHTRALAESAKPVKR